MIRLKRAYDEPSQDDGARILVERLWPRGLTKERAKIDEWRKELSPSPELRKWYSHEIEKWPEFRRRYEAELKAPELQDSLRDVARRARADTVTLVFATKDHDHSSAAILADVLRFLSN